MKITKARLRQLISEEIAASEEEEEMRHTPDYSEYELNDMDTDHQMVALMKEVVAQLKTLNQYMTPAKDPVSSAAEKASASFTVAEASRKKRNRPADFKSGDRVSHKEYGDGTVTHPGAATSATGGREVSVKWDNSSVGQKRAIESNLTKK